MNLRSFRQQIRPFLLTISFSAIGFLLVFLLEFLFKIKLQKLEKSIIAFIVTSAAILILFPRIFKIPFGKVSLGEFMQRVGLYQPEKVWKYVFIGVVGAICTLSGMLVGSFLTGKYAFDFSTVTLSQAIFSLTPGIWEEVLFRGVLMLLLLKSTRDIKKAIVIQLLLFGLVHIKGFDLLAVVDAFSVMIIATAFTYSVYKTHSLIPAIIFHYLHDTFLFAVQLPDGVYSGFRDNAFFYGGLWISVLTAIFLFRALAERFHISGEYDLYGQDDQTRLTGTQSQSELNAKQKEQRSKKNLLINTLGFVVILLLSLGGSTLLVQILIGLYVILCFTLLLFWKKIKMNFDVLINLLSAFIAVVTGYDLYLQGSRQVYFIWYLIGVVFLILAVVKKKAKAEAKAEVSHIP